MIQSYSEEFITLALVHFLAVIAPGPDFAITIRQSIRFGRSIGIATALGIGAGISLHVGYTLLGVSALLHSYPWLLTLTSLIGATYLGYLGINLMRSIPRSSYSNFANTTSLNGNIKNNPSLKQSFLLGFLTNATNPKATLFFLAIFTTLVQPETPFFIQGIYGLWMCAVNATWFALVAVLFTVENIRVSFLKIGHWLERMMGIVLIIFSLRLIWQVIY